MVFLLMEGKITDIAVQKGCCMTENPLTDERHAPSEEDRARVAQIVYTALEELNYPSDVVTNETRIVDLLDSFDVAEFVTLLELALGKDVSAAFSNSKTFGELISALACLP